MTNKKLKLRHVHLSQNTDKKQKADKKELAMAFGMAAVLLSSCARKTDDCGNDYPEEFCNPNKSTPKIIDNEDGTQTIVGVKDKGDFTGKIEFSYGDIAGLAVLLAIAALANKNLWKYIKREKKPKNNRDSPPQSDF